MLKGKAVKSHCNPIAKATKRKITPSKIATPKLKPIMNKRIGIISNNKNIKVIIIKIGS